MGIILGIDPGLKGGLVTLNAEGEIVSLLSMPTRVKLHGKGQQIDGYEVSSWLLAQKDNQTMTGLLEAVNAMPGQGVTSMFSFGEGVGIVQGVLQALSIPYRMATPACWKRRAGLTGKDKGASRSLAQQLWPDYSDVFAVAKNEGLAEAALIAKFGGGQG